MTELHPSLERIPWSGSAPASMSEVTGAERPGAGCRRPDDVLNHPTMQADEKRALLASWVSDARAVPDRPALRRLDNGAVVALDDILRALKSLDDDEDWVTTPARVSPRPDPLNRRRRAAMVGQLARTVRRHRRDDDDEPPPCPAVAGRPVARVSTDAIGQVLGLSARHRSGAAAFGVAADLPAAA